MLHGFMLKIDNLLIERIHLGVKFQTVYTVVKVDQRCGCTGFNDFICAL